MAVIESEIYFWVQFWWWHLFGKMEIYWHTRFRWDISVNGWYKTTSGFGKWMATILKLYFRFIFSPNFRHRCHYALACQISSKSNYPWWSYDVILIFLRWRPAAILDFIWIILDHRQSAIADLWLVLQFRLDRIYSFGDIAMAWNCLFAPIFGGFWGHISPNDVTHRPNTQKALPYAESHRLSHKAWKSVQRFGLHAFPRKKDRTGQSKKITKL